MDKASRARQRLLALFLPLAAVLYVSAGALDPQGTDQVVTTAAGGLRLLDMAARHPTQLDLAGALSILALGALAAAYTAIARLIRNRGWVLATVAALLGALGAFCGAIVNVLVDVNLAFAATSHRSREAGAQFQLTSFSSTTTQLFSLAYFASEYLAPVLMGLALWRSRATAPWLALLFAVGLEIAETQPSKGPVVIWFMLPFTASMVLLSARIWQAAARPATHDPHCAPSPTPIAGRGPGEDRAECG